MKVSATKILFSLREKGCLLRRQLKLTRVVLRKREHMVQKMSKITIIRDILPVKINV